MDWAAIKAAVKDTTWKPNTPDAVVKRYALQALREIMELRDWLWLTQEVTFTASTATHTPPADMGAIEALYLEDQPTQSLYPLNLYTLPQLRTRWELGETGEPLDYAYETGVIHFGPAPAKQETFRLIYRVSDTPDTDTWSNYLTAKYPQLLIDLAAGKCLQSYYVDKEAAAPLFEAYQYSISHMEYEDDRKSRDDFSGFVQPDNGYYLAAHPSGRGRL